jgi:hypothetical protein
LTAPSAPGLLTPLIDLGRDLASTAGHDNAVAVGQL